MLSKQNTPRATVAAAIMGAFAVAGATAAAAADRHNVTLGDAAEDNGGLEYNGLRVSPNVTFTSDYRFRGFTQTRESAALQGGVDVYWRWFYVGVWATNVDFGKTLDSAGRLHEIAEQEVDYYAGIKHKVRGVEFDVGVIYYSYPGSFGTIVGGSRRDLDYFEVKAGISAEIHKSLLAGVTVYYSPDYSEETGRNWVIEGELKRTLGTWGSLVPSISAKLARSIGEESKGGFDYWYWNAGFSLVFAKYFEFDIRYYDTFDVPSSINCDHRCDGRVVARITFEY
jgi:uncharacterized protein (TIGR02001 family)